MKPKRKRSRLLTCAAILFACVFVLSAALLLISLWEKSHGDYPHEETEPMRESVRYNGREYVLRDGIETLLILGLDKTERGDPDSYNNDSAADFILLLVIDNENASVSAIRVNRDTMADINVLGVAGETIGTVRRQIALAHTYGNGRELSCRNTADAVSGLLMNAEIRHYLSVTMEAVPVYNDLVGGVEVVVEDDFSAVDDTLVQGETVLLNGEQALTFIRARSELPDATNRNRMERQKQYLEGLYAQTKSRLRENADFAVEAAVKIAGYMISDYSGERLEHLLKKISGYELSELIDIGGEYREGEKYMEFIPDGDSVEEIVIRCFYREK